MSLYDQALALAKSDNNDERLVGEDALLETSLVRDVSCVSDFISDPPFRCGQPRRCLTPLDELLTQVLATPFTSSRDEANDIIVDLVHACELLGDNLTFDDAERVVQIVIKLGEKFPANIQSAANWVDHRKNFSFFPLLRLFVALTATPESMVRRSQQFYDRTWRRTSFIEATGLLVRQITNFLERDAQEEEFNV